MQANFTKIFTITLFLLSSYMAWAQSTVPPLVPASTAVSDTTKALAFTNPASETAIEFERPINFFASAGVSYRLYGMETVTISPIDNTVQIEQASRLNSRISFGLVWNPLINNVNRRSALNFKSKFVDQIVKQSIQAARSNAAFALLVNVYQLSFSQNQAAASSPIDVGFGVGYRSRDLLIMGTIDFTPYRDPKAYFVKQFNGMNKTLIYAGSQEPVKTISLDDNSIFETRLHAFIGFKVAYAFTNSEKKAVAAPPEVKKAEKNLEKATE